MARRAHSGMACSLSWGGSISVTQAYHSRNYISLFKTIQRRDAVHLLPFNDTEWHLLPQQREYGKQRGQRWFERLKSSKTIKTVWKSNQGLCQRVDHPTLWAFTMNRRTPKSVVFESNLISCTSKGSCAAVSIVSFLKLLMPSLSPESLLL